MKNEIQIVHTDKDGNFIDITSDTFKNFIYSEIKELIKEIKR